MTPFVAPLSADFTPLDGHWRHLARSQATNTRFFSSLLEYLGVDLQLARPAHTVCHGKGRKDRVTPLNPDTCRDLLAWQLESRNPAPAQAVFTSQGTRRPLTVDAVEQRIRIHSATAALTCPSLVEKTITPHVLRHTTAMRMLAAGIDVATISLCLGHESIDSTSAYLKSRELHQMGDPNTSLRQLVG